VGGSLGGAAGRAVRWYVGCYSSSLLVLANSCSKPLPVWADWEWLVTRDISLKLYRRFDGQSADRARPFTLGMWHWDAPDPPRSPDPPP